MIPAEGLFISQYQMLDGWNLVNKVAGLALVYTAAILPFTIWMLRGFVAGVPIELEEAGDGRRAVAHRRLLPHHVPAAGARASSPPACTGSCRRGTSTRSRSSS